MQPTNKSSRIERHTIFQIPLDQRHGKARQLFTLWFGANLNVLTVVTGALATTIFHQSFTSAVLAILLGNLAGTIRYTTENLGRTLLRVDFDSGTSLIVLSEDVEVEAAPDHTNG